MWLSLITDEESKDSSFIKTCLEILYKDDLTVLSNKCVKGTSTSTKRPITPKKLKIIKSEYNTRIRRFRENMEPEDFHRRLNDVRVNKLLSSSIKNICKKLARGSGATNQYILPV